MIITLPQRIDAPSTKIFVQINGKKFKDTILMLPGGPGGNATIYDEIARKMARRYRVIRFDPRGCARSIRDYSSAKEFCSIDHYVKDIESIRAFFNLKNFTLLGGSYGAMAALKYAVSYCKDNYLKNLITIGGASSGKFIDAAISIINNKVKEGLCSVEQQEWAVKLFAGRIKNPEEFREYYGAMKNIYFFNVNKEYKPLINKKIKSYDYYIEITNDGFRPGGFLRKFDITTSLNEITCRVLMMVGENDWINQPEDITLIADGIKNSGNKKVYKVIIKKCGHFIPIEQPRVFYSHILKFLEER